MDKAGAEGRRGAGAAAGILDNLMRLVGRRGRIDLEHLAEALLSERGEASGVALGCELLRAYDDSDGDQRQAFLTALAERFGAPRRPLERAIARYQEDPTPANGVALHFAAESRRQELVRRLNLAPGGTAGLVRMREQVLAALKAHPELAPVDADFLHLFTSWFNRGFLTLRRIDWQTPALVLERIIRYEAVHEITSWDDLRRRIDPEDRRCFAFFHPALPDEPLIFVEVALVPDVPDKIGPLLAPDRQPIAASRARTAVFYSISNCQVGLTGVPLGNFLIRQVVQELARELPALRTFVTLSPVPGFAAWLGHERRARSSDWLSDQDRQVLDALDTPGWHASAAAARALKPVLTTAVARYLVGARDSRGRPMDPVARFHLRNGARLERIHWLADDSVRGLEQSAGFMVNYLYDPGQIEKNHQLYVNEGRVAASRAVEKLAGRGGRGAARP